MFYKIGSGSVYVSLKSQTKQTEYLLPWLWHFYVMNTCEVIATISE